ncbi:MAG: hypothetical protein LBU25_01310 [Treponema sp.]|jgi:hypothetical protein|nr:hypothetical protein [Treponema sp.]
MRFTPEGGLEDVRRDHKREYRFQRRRRGTIDGTNAVNYGKVAYAGGGMVRNIAVGPLVNLDNNVFGSRGGWE